jgi:hypothetical protein
MNTNYLIGIAKIAFIIFLCWSAARYCVELCGKDLSALIRWLKRRQLKRVKKTFQNGRNTNNKKCDSTEYKHNKRECINACLSLWCPPKFIKRILHKTNLVTDRNNKCEERPSNNRLEMVSNKVNKIRKHPMKSIAYTTKDFNTNRGEPTAGFY